MAGKYLKVYYDMMQAVEALGDSEAGRLIKGAMRYGATGESPSLSGGERSIWPLIKERIDDDNARHKKQCEVNKKNITNRYESIRIDTNRNESLRIVDLKERENKEERSKEENKDNRKITRYARPAREEVRAYARERNSCVNPDQFFDYFETGNWVDAKGQPVRNWKQKFLTWEAKQSEKQAPKPESPARPDLSWLKGAKSADDYV